MTSISRNVHTDKSDDIVNKYNNKNHRTTKRKPIDIKTSTYVDFDVEINNKDSKFKVGDPVKVSKYKNNFEKCFTLENGKKRFMLLKNYCHGYM